MPSFNIHLAVAKQYINKHREEIRNENEFLKGAIRPDLNESLTEICEDKCKTHYGQLGYRNDGYFETNINKFLEDSTVDITKDFFKGYLLHLLTDYYFYNKYFNKEFRQVIKNKDRFHYDFSCTNKMLEEKYGIELIEPLKKYTTYSNGKTKYLDIQKLINFIEELSSIDLQKHIENIKSNGITL